MPSLWFIVPAHGRAELARICLTQLRRTCDQLEQNGIKASAVVIADDENLDTARDLGFAWVRRDNRFLGRKFNDGIQLACDREHNRRPVDYVVPCGSDDWVDWRLFTDLPARNQMYGFQAIGFVNETGDTLSVVHDLGYRGGAGIRIYPQKVMHRLGYRPCDEYRRRGCDTSILVNLLRAQALTQQNVVHRPSDPLQIVDWKSPDEQVNTYRDVVARHHTDVAGDPFVLLSDRYPADALAAMRDLYAARVPVAA